MERHLKHQNDLSSIQAEPEIARTTRARNALEEQLADVQANSEIARISKTQNTPLPQSLNICLPGYTFIKQIGGGSQGKVFLARRDIDGTDVAIKRLDIESVQTWKTYELFHREADVLSKLHIKGVAHFYEAIDRVDDNPPCAYIVQEYIPGNTLGALLQSGHRFSLSCTFDIIIQILQILKQLHSHTPPVIHRDIKPSNIMLKPTADDRYQVYILDFGAVANPQLKGKGGSTVAGTFGFMPPEQLMGKPVFGSDIYALAAVAVNMMSGVSPSSMEVKAYRLIFEPYMQFMPVAVIDTLHKMLEPEIAHRLCDYDILIDTFEHFKRGEYTTGSIRQTTSMSARAFNSRLKAVNSYAESSNLELWQQLPDKTPRAIPSIYENIRVDTFKNERLYFKNHSSLYDSNYSYKKKEFMDVLNGVIKLSFYPLLIVFLILLASLNFRVILTAAMIVVCAYFILYSLIRVSSRKYSFGRKQRKVDNLMQAKFYAVIKNGRKMLATIVSVEYQKIDDQQVEYHTSTLQQVVHDRPKFIVRYRFNPPDDSSSADLVHCIKVGEALSESLIEGAPLPILYRIYKDKTGMEHVDSTPFPCVLSDITSYKDILGRSSCMSELDRLPYSTF